MEKLIDEVIEFDVFNIGTYLRNFKLDTELTETERIALDKALMFLPYDFYEYFDEQGRMATYRVGFKSNDKYNVYIDILPMDKDGEVYEMVECKVLTFKAFLIKLIAYFDINQYRYKTGKTYRENRYNFDIFRNIIKVYYDCGNL